MSSLVLTSHQVGYLFCFQKLGLQLNFVVSLLFTEHGPFWVYSAYRSSLDAALGGDVGRVLWMFPTGLCIYEGDLWVWYTQRLLGRLFAEYSQQENQVPYLPLSQSPPSPSLGYLTSYSGCYWKEMGFSICTIGIGRQSLIGLLFLCRRDYCCQIDQPPCGISLAGRVVLGKVLLQLPRLWPNFYFIFSNDVLESPLGKAGLLQILPHVWVYAQVSTLQGFSPTRLRGVWARSLSSLVLELVLHLSAY